MAVTVRESILNQLKIMLAAITVANGYSNDVKSVQRWRQFGNDVKNCPTIVLVVGEETKQPVPNPFYTNSMPVALCVWLSQDENDGTDTDTLISSILGDVEKCIGADPTIGGFAIDALFKSNAEFQDVPGQPNSGIIPILEITYQTRISDPTMSV